MSNRIIAIGRQSSSGGSTIGKEVARKLGIPCYDTEVLERMAQESGFTIEYVKEYFENAASRNWLSNVLTARDFTTNAFQDDFWAIQNKIIKDLAEQGPCVFVGFCAEYILRKHDNCLRVFLHADVADRAKWLAQNSGESLEAAEKHLKEKDRRRAAYYQFYTDLKWGAAENYHVTLNTGELGIDKCVDVLTSLY